MSNNSYNSSSVSVLSDIDHIQQRPGMYIGEPDNPKHLLKEAFDNSLDEAQNGHCTCIIVKADTKNNVYSVYDEGRGIPIGTTTYEYNGITIEMETLQVLTTVGKAGGKFNNNNYKVRGGLHGLGNKCITALSEYAKFETRRDGKMVRLITNHGAVESLEYYDTELPNGCYVEFKGDAKIFDDVAIPTEKIYEFCNIASAFGYPVKYYLDGELVELDAKEIFDLVPNEEYSEYARTMISSSKSETEEGLQVALKYTSDISSKSFAYTNLIPNRYGGTHVRAVEKAVEEVWSEFYSETEVELRPFDCRLGLRSVVALFINDPSFLGQTKDKLNNKASEFQELIDGFKKNFRDYLIENEKVRKALLKRFSEYRLAQNSLLARKEIMSLIKVNEPNSSNSIRRKSIVPTLKECKSPHKAGTELILVEGESAAGGFTRVRDRNTQAILPVGGKIQNVTWKSVKDALKSEDIRDIVNSVGAGVGEEADPRRCRYEKIYLSSDADPDGKHITALELSVMINLLPELVKAGMVYILHAPLFGWREGKKIKFAMEFSDIPENIRKSKDFTRYKGLGEMDDDELKEALLNKENRIITKVDYPSDLDRFNEILGTSHGKSSLLKDLGIIKWK